MFENKTFGVELEFIAPSRLSFNAVADALSAAGVSTRSTGYTHATTSYWKIVTDGSVSGNGTGMELVSPVLSGEAGLAKLKIACDTLTQLGCTVNRTCGLHVHIGASDMQVVAMRRLAIMYSDFETVLDSVMPSSRRSDNNQYLRSLRTMSKANIRNAGHARDIASQINGGSRYAKLNFTSHWKHGTIEFRHHAGTVNYTKARMWVLACLRMVTIAEREETAPITVAPAARRINRPNGALGVIFDLVSRPNGCTREEARVALGRTSPPAMNRITEDAGIPLRRVGQRYFLAEQPTVNTAAPNAPVNHPINLTGFCAKLEMTEDEQAFWRARQDFFAADTIGERVNFAPGTLAARRAAASQR